MPRKILRKIPAILIAPGHQEMDQSCVSSSGRKPTRNINPNPTMYSQERQQDDTQSSSNLPAGEKNLRAQPAPGNWSEVRTSKSESQRWSSATRRSSTIDTLRVFKNLWKSLNLAEEAPVIGIEALKNNVLIGGYVDNDESRHSSWTKLH